MKSLSKDYLPFVCWISQTLGDLCAIAIPHHVKESKALLSKAVCVLQCKGKSKNQQNYVAYKTSDSTSKAVSVL